MPKLTTRPSLAELTATARGLINELSEIGRSIDDKLNQGIDRAWRLGKTLVAMKRQVGHGNWLVCVEGLGISARHATRHMELAIDNPHAKSVADLSNESVRKFRLRYVPEKERPEIDGDETIPRACHHLSLVNDWRRMLRRVEIGQAQLNPEEARRDLRPLYDWLRGLYDGDGAER